MARNTFCLLAALVICCAFAEAATDVVVPKQPFKFIPAPFAAVLTEAAQRAEDNYTGFVFDFKKVAPADGGTPLSTIRSNQANNPFLSTLPGRGNGQTLVTMGPCSGNSAHTHPRGSEISYLTYGQLEFGMVEENAGKNKLVQVTLRQGQTIHIPQGLMHFSYNTGCQPAQFLANFGERDPGTQTIWHSLVKIPDAALNAATGIPESMWKSLKTYPLAIAPTTGGEECMKKCGLTYKTANAFLP